MSKLGPVQSNMAALFTGESERLRAQQSKESESQSAELSASRANSLKLKEGNKSGDSLGNPSSPGYDAPPNRKKHHQSDADSEKNNSTIQIPDQPNSLIRLQAGWEKLLLAQKKICEKAKNLFLALNAPERYRKKNTLLESKSRGNIINLDTKELRHTEKESDENSDTKAA